MERGKLSEIIASIIHLSLTKGKKYSGISVFEKTLGSWADTLSSEFGSRLDLNQPIQSERKQDQILLWTCVLVHIFNVLTIIMQSLNIKE